MAFFSVLSQNKLWLSLPSGEWHHKAIWINLQQSTISSALWFRGWAGGLLHVFAAAPGVGFLIWFFKPWASNCISQWTIFPIWASCLVKKCWSSWKSDNLGLWSSCWPCCVAFQTGPAPSKPPKILCCSICSPYLVLPPEETLTNVSTYCSSRQVTSSLQACRLRPLPHRSLTHSPVWTPSLFKPAQVFPITSLKLGCAYWSLSVRVLS